MPRSRRFSRFPVLLLVFSTLAVGSSALAGSTDITRIEVLSNRADLISGGDAFVAIDLPAGTVPSTIDLNGGNVASQFAARANGRFEALLTGLNSGDNLLTVTLPDNTGASITITNHSIGGPIFSGPQITPWKCGNGSADPQCIVAATTSYSYKDANTGRFTAYDPNSPPAASSIAMATPQNGPPIPYIVRLETGAIDRDEYRIAELYQPGVPWTAWASQPQFNHKLVITHGASCDTAYATAAAPDVMNDTALNLGFAVMSNALDNAGHNCNIVTQGEALIMTKERVIESLGELRYTMGSGCSGGSLVQQQLANAYPGLYQGITPQCSYPDAWSSAMQYIDYDLMLQYFQKPQNWGAGVVWDPASMGFALGHPNAANPITFTTVIPNSGKPSRPCPGLSAAEVWSPSNPTGVRCTLYDYMVNVFGKEAGHAYANSPWDNTGVQYGLKSFLAGKLSFSQFIDINAKLGGLDHNGAYVPARNDGVTAATAAMYRSGASNQANHLDQVAIIDLRGPDVGSFHDVYRTYAIRARLEREHGTAANQVLWRGFVSLLGDANFVSQSIVAMDGWLNAIDNDHRTNVTLAQKIIDDRNVPDRCTNGAGVELPSPVCDAVVQTYTTPRIEATMPFTDDVMKCQLKQVRASDYYPTILTDAQLAQVQTTFPSGVCDYTRPGVGQQDTVAWQTYQHHDGSVLTGGAPMGPAPESSPF